MTTTKPPKPSRPPLLQRLRERRALSLEDVAKETGACRSAVSKWEHLLSEPQLRYRKPYAEILGISLARLGRMYYEIDRGGK